MTAVYLLHNAREVGGAEQRSAAARPSDERVRAAEGLDADSNMRPPTRALQLRPASKGSGRRELAECLCSGAKGTFFSVQKGWQSKNKEQAVFNSLAVLVPPHQQSCPHPRFLLAQLFLRGDPACYFRPEVPAAAP